MDGELTFLGPRLSCAAALVRRGSRLADIGTDHALLPTALVAAGVCPSAIAADIRPGPLARARQTVEGAGLSDCISLRLGGGLSVMAAGEADDIVVAGMGGENIASILGEAGWLREPRYRLILQPMSRPEELRRWLRCNGFAIEREPAVREGKRLYTVLQAAYRPGAVPPGNERLTAADYKGGVDGRDGEAAAAYLLHQRDRLLKQAAGLRGSFRAEDREEAERLEEIAGGLPE